MTTNDTLTLDGLRRRRAELAAELERLLANANWLQGRIAQLDELIGQASETKEEKPEEANNG